VAARSRRLARLRLELFRLRLADGVYRPALRAGIALLLATLGAAVGCREAAPPAPAKAQRIVSLVPAVTEMLFAIGAGAQVVAVSNYDHFPSEVEALPKVGALINPDTERILALRPDMVVVYGSQNDVEARFKKAGIQTFNYRHGVTDAILGTLDTITALGAATGHEAQAREVVVRITTGLDDVRKRVAGLDRPRTILVIGRQPGTLQGIYVQGGSGFLNEMLEVAGGQNVFEDVKRESVQPSSETLLRRAPDVLLELRADAPAGTYTAADVEVWNTLASIPAVRNRRVHSLAGDHVVVAGPRIAQGAEAMARALHPDAFK
jgi:iron complex transport system substrate-binding protein